MRYYVENVMMDVELLISFGSPPRMRLRNFDLDLHFDLFFFRCVLFDFFKPDFI
jgi:hypothetical protein